MSACIDNPASCNGYCLYEFHILASSCTCIEGTYSTPYGEYCSTSNRTPPTLGCTISASGGGGYYVGGCQQTCGNGACADWLNCPSYQSRGCCWNSGGNIPCCTGSPILIDTIGEGIRLTPPESGVLFRAGPGAVKSMFSWTSGQSQNGWLVIDRNNNNQVDDLSEMFGAVSPQPDSAEPNGYRALEVFDQPSAGGNGDGAIDASDAAFSRLRVWIDENHDGISQPEELRALPSVGVLRIGLAYWRSKYQDAQGNQFRFGAIIIDRSGSHATFDVFLRSAEVPK